ncbi:MobF family relaxase [Catenulispora rubra]|uniref:MobF family relaxase n=1 Tax=Catenulispora rubra TaxID=280293 RepID=UPI0018920600|nr:MobF family relaxase [Catenulispora rubra]
MTIHKLTAGEGYSYLTRQVAGGDLQRARGQQAADYYTAKGNPPGVWMGRGAPVLELADQAVTEAQMKALFGLGQHPDADRIIAEYLAEHVRAGMTEQQREVVQAAAIKAASLGRRFPSYEPLDAFAARVAKRLEVIAEQTGREPTAAEAKKVQREESTRQRAAVAGFDIVFAPVKSAAVLWAIDERGDIRAAVRAAHEAARDAAIELLEEHAAFTRTGDVGQAQIATRGLIAAAFDHYDSRAGDPNLHTHVAVSNKVLSVDGKWRSLDARALYAMTVAASEFYNTRFEVELSARLGVGFAARSDTPRGKEPVREVVGVPEEFIAHYSSRRSQIEARYDQLVREYRRDHGHDPSRSTAHLLARQANLDTREGKKAARSLGEMRADWRQSLIEAHGPDAVARVMAAIPANAASDDTESVKDVDVEALAALAIERVQEQRATWTVWNVWAEVERLARTDHTAADPEEHREVVAQILAMATGPEHSISIDAPVLLEDPDILRRGDGVSVFTRHAAGLFTSQAVLDAEDRLVTAALTPTVSGLSSSFAAAALDGFEARNRSLDDSQRALVTAFATDNRMLVVGLGPAGSGKTAAMKAYVHIAGQAGQRVIPLATSAAAAAVLGKDLGATAENLHKFLWEHTDGPYAAALRGGADVPRSRSGFVLRPGDVVLVDEAGMAGTMNLDRLVTLAASHGATVRLLGDYRQLGAVEAGGALRRIANEAGAVELTELHRFNNKAEAAATLKVRVGDGTGLDFYDTNGRIRAGSREAMVDAAYDGWRADMLAKKTTVISAAAGVDVVALSAKARADRVTAGQVEADGVVLRDGNLAGKNDWILTRDNNRKLSTARGKDFVKNGDAWEVLRRNEDGSLKVARLGGKGRITLPADYVRNNVELLYASTAMRTQGDTVDTAHPLVTPEMTRETLYVMLTRAREHTTLYVATHDLLPFDSDAQLDFAKNDPASYAGREVLEKVLAREGAELSATDTIRVLQEQASSLSTLVPNHQHRLDVLTAERYTGLLADVLGQQLSAQITADSAFTAVVRALNTAEAGGWQPERLIADAARRGDLAAADNPAKLLAWRVNATAADRTAPAHLNAPSHADAARYAALMKEATGITADRLNLHAATAVPAVLRVGHTDVTAAGTHPRVPATTLGRYAEAAATALGTTADQVTGHRSWPHLAGAIAAADRAGRDVNVLLNAAARATSRNDDGTEHTPQAIADLARASRRILAADGIRSEHQTVPASLRHAHTAYTALGLDIAETARRESTWPALTAALRRAETAGHNPADLLRALAAQRKVDGADSISQVLAWRINRHLADTAAPAVRVAHAENRTWNAVAWTLKAAENTGADVRTILAGAPGTDLGEVHHRVQQLALDAARTSAEARELPAWITTATRAAMAEPRHGDYLKASADLIADRFTALGEQTTTTRPAWSADLGQAPEDPAARAAWQHQLAVIAAYRDQYAIADDNRTQPAGPYIETGRAGHDAYWHAAAAALTAKRISDVPNNLPDTSTTPDRTARNQVAADLYRALPEDQQSAVLHTIAQRVGAAWLTSAKTIGDDALAKPAIADHLNQALADHGHLPAESKDAKTMDVEEIEPRAKPTLSELRRAGREADRAARREEILARRAQPGSHVQRPTQQRRDEPARQPQRPAIKPRPDAPQTQPAPRLIQPPPTQQPDQQQPRPRW